MNKLRAVAVLLILAAFLSLPCRRQTSVRGIELAVSFSPRALSENLFTEITYRFKTTPRFAPLTEDGRVAAELVARGRKVFRDEFEPPVPTSKWEAGREYTFSRRVYIPPFIDEFSPDFRGTETAVLDVGLVFPSASGPGARIAVSEKRMRILPASDAPSVVYLSGWYPQETDPAEPGTTWRWTARTARAAIDNPGRDALLVIRGEAGASAPSGQVVTVAIDGRTLDEFAPGTAPFEKRYAVSRDRLAGRRDFVLSIGVDRTFVPARAVPGSRDERELGVRISLIYFR
ncbi:MAG TPA: hypothetical protein VMS75_06395 [Terriglobales bacterium]|nr:hypothetical protein [Terriglobales bacterium]